MSWRRGFRTGAAALGALIVIGGTVAATGFTWTGGATRVANDSGPRAGVPHQVSEAAQDKALSYWTAQRMLAAATASGTKAAKATAPKGIPTATKFTGSPPTGALFYTTGGKAHYCSASVVDSTVGDLVLTAAHCVYTTNFATNIEYVPEYHDLKQPYGAWPVVTIYVASGWQHSHNPNLDFAFLSVTPASKGPDIQKVTGGLTIEFTQWYSQKIEVVAHNDIDAKPVRCATKSFRFRTGQMEFYCHGFFTGTSGGPWIIGYNAKTGGGKVFGVIGGYEEGGDYDWASYSSYFGPAARSLFQQAEHQTVPPPPTPSPSATSASAASAASATTPSTPPASATTPSAASASATSPSPSPSPSAPATPSPSPSATPTVVST